MAHPQPFEHVRLDRRVQLHDVVTEHERFEIRQAELVDRDRFEQVRIQRRIVRALVGEAQVALRIGVLRRHRLHQRQGVGEIVARDDGEEDEWIHSGVSEPLHCRGQKNQSQRNRDRMCAYDLRTRSISATSPALAWINDAL